MTLDDTDPKLFAVLAQWLYSRSTLPINFFRKFSLAFMAQLWILGDRFLMIEFQNYIAEIVVHKMSTSPKVEADAFGHYVEVAGAYAKGENLLIKLAVYRLVCLDVGTFNLCANHLQPQILSMVVVDLKRLFSMLAVRQQPVFGMSDHFLVKRKQPTK
jgi:hypothetical protein